MATTANRKKVHLPVKLAEGIPYTTPAQEPAPGTFVQTRDDRPQPKIFEPITIRGVTFQNRIWVCLAPSRNQFLHINLKNHALTYLPPRSPQCVNIPALPTAPPQTGTSRISVPSPLVVAA